MSNEARPIAKYLIDWYFANRESSLAGLTLQQVAQNDRLWFYICQHHKTPSAFWMDINAEE